MTSSRTCPPITGETKVFCVFGNPISHSKSPLLHNAAFRAHGYNGVYVPFRIEKAEDIPLVMKLLSIRGANITIPHKTAVIPFLDGASSEVSTIGACNTIINTHGRLIGYNTDWIGFASAVGIRTIPSARVLLIGAGGAARAILYALIHYKASEVVVVNRTPDRLHSFIRDFSSLAHASSVKIAGCSFDDLAETLRAPFDIIINATSVGMESHDLPLPVAYLSNVINKDSVVFDAVYTPRITRFLRFALRKHARIVLGERMLILQAAHAFRLFTNLPLPVRIMERAYKKAV